MYIHLFFFCEYYKQEFINIVSVPSHSDGKTFTYDSDRPKQWHGETDVWAHGFWYILYVTIVVICERSYFSI